MSDQPQGLPQSWAHGPNSLLVSGWASLSVPSTLSPLQRSSVAISFLQGTIPVCWLLQLGQSDKVRFGRPQEDGETGLEVVFWLND